MIQRPIKQVEKNHRINYTFKVSLNEVPLPMIVIGLVLLLSNYCSLDFFCIMVVP